MAIDRGASLDVEHGSGKWIGAWPDLVAFVTGLGVAWFAGWSTTDLVWSLWLASLTLGFALIAWNITRPLRELLRRSSEDRRPPGTGVTALVAGAVFGLAFFAFHFGMFHYVHSVFLNMFFPIGSTRGPLGPSDFFELLSRYWIWLPVAFLAERRAFTNPPGSAKEQMSAPYKNVVRLHLLIFFFAFAHAIQMAGFIVYSVVYAVYFFPWRLLSKE